MFVCTLTARAVMLDPESGAATELASPEDRSRLLAKLERVVRARTGGGVAVVWSPTDEAELSARFRCNSLVQLDGLLSALRWSFVDSDSEEDEGEEDEVEEEQEVVQWGMRRRVPVMQSGRHAEERPVLDRVHLSVQTTRPVLSFGP